MSEIIVQGSKEWFAARRGKLGASQIADATARTKGGGWGASRANIMARLIAERLTGVSVDTFQSAEMKWGIETEPEARTAYEFYHDVTVEQVGFILHPTMPDTGASPDGCVGTDGLLEIKCPNTATHIDTLLGAPIDGKYIKQMQWQMRCTGRSWVDFASYDPRMPPRLRLYVERVPRDDKMIAALEVDVREFLAEMTARAMALLSKYPLEVENAT